MVDAQQLDHGREPAAHGHGAGGGHRPHGDANPLARSIVLYGDFNCPWSYLAALRADRLAAAGLVVDWRAVEHDPQRPSRVPSTPTRFDCLRQEMEHVLALLEPCECFPYSLAGFLPHTRPALSGYAEAYDAGVAPQVRRLLFDAFWVHAVDLGDPKVVRTLLAEVIREGSSASEMRAVWGYAVAVTGAPVTGEAHRLLREWRTQWLAAGKETVPVLVVDGGSPLFGEAAVEWLGAEMLARGLDPALDVRPAPRHPARRVATPSLHWATHAGHRWHQAYQDAHSSASTH